MTTPRPLMSPYFRLLLIPACWLTQSVVEAVRWIERRGMAGATFQAEFDQWTAAPYSLRLTRLSGSEVSGEARFTALFERSAKTTPWASHAGLTAADFTSTHASLHGAGL